MGVSYYVNEEKVNLLRGKGFLLNSKKNLIEIKYDNLIQNICEGVFCVDHNFRITDYNDRFLEIIGYTKEEIKTISFYEILPYSYDTKLKFILEKLGSEKSIVKAKLEIRCKNNIIKTAFFNIRRIEQNTIQFIIGEENILTDYGNILNKNIEMIENIKAMENKINEIIEYDKLKTDFFTNISHEIRTPLNVISAIIQLYEKSCVDDEKGIMKKYTRIMKQNCFRLLRLINNLIDITKIDGGYFKINKRNCNIVSLVEDITISVAEYVESKGIELIFDTDTEEKIIACDPDKIERIMMNLLSNAIKFTPTGGYIHVNVYDQGENTKVVIKDNGIGIAKNKIQDVFQRYIQGDKQSFRQNEGSGIGLALVKSLVEMHGGEINLISDEGLGAEFIIDLPSEQLPQEFMVGIDSHYNTNKIEKINIEFSDIYT